MIKQNIEIKLILLEIIDIIFPDIINQSKKDLKVIDKMNILYSSMIYYYKYKIVSNSVFSENKKIICIICIFLAFKEANNIIDINRFLKK